MLYKDNRGSNKKKEAEKNKSLILEWYVNNQEGTAIQCSKDTGLSYKTVLKHIKTLKGM